MYRFKEPSRLNGNGKPCVPRRIYIVQKSRHERIIMFNKIQKTIEDHSMLKSGERVLVALSGGADSVCLALVLKDLGYDVFCVHVNHHLRGEESDRDEAFCIEFCKANKLDITIENVDVKGFCSENKLSLEEGARILRYEALAKHCKGSKLATAHNLNDCFETTLFNLTRGCGINGLLGIPPVRDNIIRPLINVTRGEIESYLSNRGQAYVTDSTNLVDNCSRNIIRLNVLPELLKINPGLFKTYEAELKTLSEANEYIETSADRAFQSSKTDRGYDISNIKDDAIISLVISKILKENHIMPTYERITGIKNLAETDGRLNIQKGVYIVVASGKITVSDGSGNEKHSVLAVIDAENEFCGKKLNITKLSHYDISTLNNDSLKWLLDADKLVGKLILRSYIGNEKIKLCGRDFTSTVKKLLSHVPPCERNRQIILADDLGAVFVEGSGVAERVRVDSGTQSALLISVNKA